MKGNTIIYENFTVYPEYCELPYKELQRLSLLDDNFHVATLPILGYNMGLVFHQGRVVARRPKYRLHFSENITPGRSQPTGLILGDKRVLILICYELLFPEDYLLQNRDRRADLVLHLVGYPMFSEYQKEDWTALHKVISILYSCPVVCCCGGEQTPMNLTGITTMQ